MKPGRIFISYARGDDPEFVRTLHRDLLARARASGERGLGVFFDKQDMPSRGKSFLLEIRDFIGDPETERVLLVVGPRAVESTYVQAEWRAALQRCVIVVPLLRLGRPRHANPRDARRVDEEDYGSIPAEIRETRVHAVDFRQRRGARPGRPYADALEELWRILAMPTSLAGLGPDVPDLPGNFVARTDYLAALGRLVLPDADEPVTVEAELRFVVLSGMGGVGKSVLAAAFCRACKTRRSFEDGIAWVRMGPRPELPVELVDVLGPSRRAARAGKVRAGLQDLSCLIVLDDVTDPTHVTRLKNALGEGGRLLMTTRDGAVATALNAQRCDVDLLSEAESLQLLADWSGHDAADLPREALDALAECGRLPLAVSMIGAMMRGKPRDRWNNVLADLQSANLDEIRHRFPNYDHPDLLRALKVSVDGLEGPAGDPGFAWERKVEARRRYLELAIFPGNTPLPLTALHRYWAPAGVGEPLTAKLADLFVDRNLARRDESGGIVLHDLQRDYIVSEQREALTVLNRRFLEAHRPQSGWQTAANDGYLFGHLADHLRAAGLEQELNGLVSRAWMEARFAASGSHRGFADDVEVVISAGAEGGDLVTLARDCLVLGTVAQLATEATPTFIGTMARNGEVDKALHNASLMADKSTRVNALGEICVVLMEQGGLSAAQRVVEQLLQDLERSEGSKESHRRLQLLGFSWAARCLAELRRPEPAAAAAARALALLDARTDTGVRVKVLDNVARTFLHLNRRPEARRFARQALKAARGPSSSRAELLRDAAILLIAVGDETSLSNALALLHHKGRVVGHEPAEALLLVAEALAEAGQKERAAALVQSVRAAIPGVRDRGWQAALISSTAITLGRIGQGRQAEALSKRALLSIGRPRTRFTTAILHNAAILAITLGQKTRAVQLAGRALKAIPADSPERLTEVGTVAQVLSDVGRREEASAILGDALAAAWAIRDPLRTRDTAGILGEALIRAGKVEEGVAQITDVADVYGVRGRAQRRIAVALAATGAWDTAVSLAESSDELDRPEALRGVANVLAGGGARERAWSVAGAIGDESTRALCMCEIVPLDDKAAVGEARRTAETVGDANALGILAERLAVQVSPAAGREVARQALDVARQLKHHDLVIALGDLGRPFLLAGDDAGVRRVDALLRKVDDEEYRAYGRLRLALALAQAGHAARARAIVRKELPGVERLEGSDVAKASLLAAIALTLMHTGAEGEAVRRARQALVTLGRAGGSSSSAYDNDLTRSRAVAVLTRTGALAEAFADGEVAFEDLARAGAERGGLAGVRPLLTEARQQAEGAHRADALAWVAWALGTLGAQDEARPLVGEALRSARRIGRTSVLAVVEISADVIASIDSGDTLLRLCDTVREVESWWAHREPRRR